MTPVGRTGARAAAAAIGITILTACNAGGPGTPSFEDMVESGASCEELYEIRNRADADDERIRGWNEQLREIGCFSSTSTRTD